MCAQYTLNCWTENYTNREKKHRCRFENKKKKKIPRLIFNAYLGFRT